MIRAWVDGIESATVPVDDRGLAYGDGLFETMAVREGGVRLLGRHMDRLGRGCDRLRIAPPERALLEREVSSAACSHQRAVLKLIVTRGSGGRGYALGNDPARRILQLHPWPHAWLEQGQWGCAVRLCNWRWSSQPALAGIKHLNRLDQVMARSEWADSDIHEGLMLDSDARLISATAGNVFVRIEDRWLTPRLDRCGIDGIARSLAFECAERMGLSIRECEIHDVDLPQVDAAFLSNAVRGLVPIARMCDRDLVMASEMFALKGMMAAAGAGCLD